MGKEVSEPGVSTWVEVFRYATPDDPAVPSGAAVTVHPVLNTEPNVVDSGWIRTGVDGGLEKVNQLFVLGGDVALRAYVMNASDDQGNNIRNADTPFLDVAAGEVRVIQATFFGRYFRVVIENSSGSTCTEISARSMGGQDSPAAITTSLDQVLLDSFPAPIVRSVTVGRRYDGVYKNTPSDSLFGDYSTALSAAQPHTLGPFATEGHKAIEMYIATDQVSATNGVVVSYTPNPGATSPTYYPGQTFTFGADAVAAGFVIKRFPPALEGFKVEYTNGGVDQGSFYWALHGKNSQTEPTSVSVENDLNSTQAAALGRSVDVAKNDIGTYGNITRGPLGGKRVSIYEHESETPIKPLNNLSGNATSVGSSAPGTQIASAPPAGTKTIEIQADPANTKVVYLGFASGVTAGNAPIALNSGDARVFEVEGTPQFWAISVSGSQTVRWTYIAEV